MQGIEQPALGHRLADDAVDTAFEQGGVLRAVNAATGDNDAGAAALSAQFADCLQRVPVGAAVQLTAEQQHIDRNIAITVLQVIGHVLELLKFGVEHFP